MCVRVVTNYFLSIFNTSSIPNFVHKICIYATDVGQSGPILIRLQPNISGVDRSIFHAGNGANYVAREAQTI